GAELKNSLGERGHGALVSLFEANDREIRSVGLLDHGEVADRNVGRRHAHLATGFGNLPGASVAVVHGDVRYPVRLGVAPLRRHLEHAGDLLLPLLENGVGRRAEGLVVRRPAEDGAVERLARRGVLRVQLVPAEAVTVRHDRAPRTGKSWDEDM